MLVLSNHSNGFLKFLKNEVKRKKSFNSGDWLKRRVKDPYIEKAKIQNYRCRSAFKLIQIDEKYKIIKAGHCVVDIGAAPGSWTQVLVEKTNALGENTKEPKGTVISVDRVSMQGVEGAEILSGKDFTKLSTQKKILELAKGGKLDFVFSDMAPNATGVKSLDADKIFNLAACVLSFAVQNLRVNGGCLVKMWEGRHEEIFREMKRFFNNVNYTKPNSSQKESPEIFLLARNFKGILPVSQNSSASSASSTVSERNEP